MAKYFRKFPIHIWFLLAIITVGIFLRAWNFSDYLRFNPDQARDAGLIREIERGEKSLPLLGPKAGGTEFRLGPAFYWIQYGSAKIFGADPQKLAYPDLFFSVLTIPLLYFFLRKYFGRKISLISTAVFSVSFYAIKYSRFAWNPNSTPFFVLLFLLALFEIAHPEQKRKWIWALILGIAMGIGVQLHSLLLFSFPVIFVVYFTYLSFQKNPAWKKIWLIIAVVIFLNIPQIINEFTALEKNSRAFIVGLDIKASRDASFAEKLETNILCHIQANGFILSSVGSDNACDLMEISKKIKKNRKDPAKIFKNAAVYANIALSVIFSLGGYILLVYFWKKEKNTDRKNFLGLLILYAAVLFVILIPLALEISMRFFLPLVFVPFIFLGLWAKFLGNRFGKKGIMTIISLAAILVILNTFSNQKKFNYWAGKSPENGDFDEITLGEVEFMSRFIIEKSQGVEKAYLKGNKAHLFEIVRPVRYFTEEYNLEVDEFRKNSKLKENEKLFSVDLDKTTDEKDAGEDYDIASWEKFRRVQIFELETK